MKHFFLFVFCFLFGVTYSQELPEREVKSQVNEVKVFLKGAQIVRQKKIDLTKGQSTLKFVSLSPFIDAKSIQVKANGPLSVMSVSHQLNYLSINENSQELNKLKTELELVDEQLNLQNTYQTIVKEEMAFLQENRNINSKGEVFNVGDLKLASEYYGSKLTTLKLKEIEIVKQLKNLQVKKRTLQNQINTLSSKDNFPLGEILVKVDVKSSATCSIELTYLVENAGWYPSYDIRAKNINEPIEIVYKANLMQDSKVDWENVKLSFSSAEPNISGIAPQLETYRLNYYTSPPKYNKKIRNVKGSVTDEFGDEMPGVSINIEGSTIGTSTNFEGHYEISIPNNAKNLVFSFMGYEQKIVPITNQTINVIMEEDSNVLEEVVVMGYNSSTVGKNKSESYKSKAANVELPVLQVENQTTIDFEIDIPYSIKADKKNYTVEMKSYSLTANYQYYCVPKIDKNAFLIAYVTDWEKYNLLEGEANIFYEDTYVGQTVLDVKYASDTLNISLGIDKKVSVNREKVFANSKKDFFGSKKQESRSWKTTVRNNKKQAVKIIILDQVPVSTMEEIKVEVDELSKAKHNIENGEIKWELDLAPGKTKELELKYSVRYPKNKNLVIE